MAVIIPALEKGPASAITSGGVNMDHGIVPEAAAVEAAGAEYTYPPGDTEIAMFKPFGGSEDTVYESPVPLTATIPRLISIPDPNPEAAGTTLPSPQRFAVLTQAVLDVSPYAET